AQWGQPVEVAVAPLPLEQAGQGVASGQAAETQAEGLVDVDPLLPSGGQDLARVGVGPVAGPLPVVVGPTEDLLDRESGLEGHGIASAQEKPSGIVTASPSHRTAQRGRARQT